MTYNVTLAFGETTFKVPLGDTGLFTEIDVKAMSAEVLRFACLNGFIGALNNISRGKDDDGKPNSDAVWATARQKKVDAWLSGTWASVERESAVAGLREAYVDETRARTGQTVKQVETDMAALVRARFGEKEKATWAAFLNALALEYKEQTADERDVETIRKLFSDRYEAAAEEARKAREAKAKGLKAKLDFSGIKL